MILTQCNGGAACFCPTVPSHDPDCFVIWGWFVLIAFTVTALIFCVWYVWSVFFKVSTTQSADQRLKRQKTFWVLTFSFIPVQIAMALTMHPDDPFQLMAWLAVAAVAGISFCVWSLRRKRG